VAPDEFRNSWSVGPIFFDSPHSCWFGPNIMSSKVVHISPNTNFDYGSLPMLAILDGNVNKEKTHWVFMVGNTQYALNLKDMKILPLHEGTSIANLKHAVANYFWYCGVGAGPSTALREPLPRATFPGWTERVVMTPPPKANTPKEELVAWLRQLAAAFAHGTAIRPMDELYRKLITASLELIDDTTPSGCKGLLSLWWDIFRSVCSGRWCALPNIIGKIVPTSSQRAWPSSSSIVASFRKSRRCIAWFKDQEIDAASVNEDDTGEVINDIITNWSAEFIVSAAFECPDVESIVLTGFVKGLTNEVVSGGVIDKIEASKIIADYIKAIFVDPVVARRLCVAEHGVKIQDLEDDLKAEVEARTIANRSLAQERLRCEELQGQFAALQARVFELEARDVPSFFKLALAKVKALRDASTGLLSKLKGLSFSSIFN